MGHPCGQRIGNHTRVCNENCGVYLTRLGNCIVERISGLPYSCQGLCAGQKDSSIFARGFERSEGLGRKRVRVSGKCKVLVGSIAELSECNRRWDGSAVAMHDCVVPAQEYTSCSHCWNGYIDRGEILYCRTRQTCQGSGHCQSCCTLSVKCHQDSGCHLPVGCDVERFKGAAGHDALMIVGKKLVTVRISDASIVVGKKLVTVRMSDGAS